MRKILFVMLLAEFSLPLAAQFSQAAKDSARIEIEQITAEWGKAIINRDSSALDKILTPEYSLNGTVTRSAWMANTLHHIATDTLKVLGEPVISFFGQAVKAEAVFFWKASLDGKPVINAEYAVTDIWIKRKGYWQVLIRMSVLSKRR